MGFHYRKTLEGDSVVGAKDYNLDATYATTAKKDDLVRLNASGNLVLAATGDTNILGVLVGFNFEGITTPTPKVGKVIVDVDAVYQADYVGAGALTIGTAYGIDGSSNMDTADTTTLIVKIVEIVNSKPYVVITARQLL